MAVSGAALAVSRPSGARETSKPNDSDDTNKPSDDARKANIGGANDKGVIDRSSNKAGQGGGGITTSATEKATSLNALMKDNDVGDGVGKHPSVAGKIGGDDVTEAHREGDGYEHRNGKLSPRRVRPRRAQQVILGVVSVHVNAETQPRLAHRLVRNVVHRKQRVPPGVAVRVCEQSGRV